MIMKHYHHPGPGPTHWSPCAVGCHNGKNQLFLYYYHYHRHHHLSTINCQQSTCNTRLTRLDWTSDRFKFMLLLFFIVFGPWLFGGELSGSVGSISERPMKINKDSQTVRWNRQTKKGKKQLLCHHKAIAEPWVLLCRPQYASVSQMAKG